MKPTNYVYKFFIDYIISNTRNKLNNLFSTNNFDLNNRIVLLSIPYNTLIYEHADTKKIFIDEPINQDDEYIVYTIDDINKKYNISTKLRESKNNLYNLVIVCEKTITKYEIVYDPDKTIPSILSSFNMNNLPLEILEEYVNVSHRFSSLSFHNHRTTTLSEIPKLTLSMNGSLFNRPDLEYYVVFGEGYQTYTVQVYTLRPNGRRNEMLFGVWINSKTKCVYNPYIIKLLTKKK